MAIAGPGGPAEGGQDHRTAYTATSIAPKLLRRSCMTPHLEWTRFETDAIPALDALVKAAKDTDPFVRWGVVRVLGQIAPAEAERAVPALGVLVADENGDV